MATLVLAGAVVLAMGAGAADEAVPPAEGGRGAYEGLKSKAGRDADGQAKLALWCEARGLTAEKARHLALAVLADTQHGLARALLGQVKDGDSWRRPEEVAEQAAEDEDRAALLADYRARRDALKDTVEE